MCLWWEKERTSSLVSLLKRALILWNQDPTLVISFNLICCLRGSTPNTPTLRCCLTTVYHFSIITNWCDTQMGPSQITCIIFKFFLCVQLKHLTFWGKYSVHNNHLYPHFSAKQSLKWLRQSLDPYQFEECGALPWHFLKWISYISSLDCELDRD